MLEKIKAMTVKQKIIAATVLVVLVAVVITAASFSFGKKGGSGTVTTSVLEKIIEINDLSTIEYTYNAVARKYNEKKPENIDFYVAYKGIVKAGIDFKKIKIELDDEKKAVTITLPPVKITEQIVNHEGMDFIFNNNDYDNSKTINREVKELCEKDLDRRLNEDGAVIMAAKESTEMGLKALFEPVIGDYEVVYKYEEE